MSSINGSQSSLSGDPDDQDVGHHTAPKNHRSPLKAGRTRTLRTQLPWGAVVEAMSDGSTWLLSIVVLAVWSAMNVLVIVGPNIIERAVAGDEKESGDEKGHTLARRILFPLPYVIGTLLALFISPLSDRTGTRGWPIALGMLASAVGFSVLALVPAAPSTYVALYGGGIIPATAGLIVSLPCLLIYILDHSPSSNTHRATTAVLSAAFAHSSVPLIAIFSPATNSRFPIPWTIISAVLLVSGALLVPLVYYIQNRVYQRMWGRGPALHRLLNDADEKDVWDMEVSQQDFFLGPKGGQAGKEDDEDDGGGDDEEESGGYRRVSQNKKDGRAKKKWGGINVATKLMRGNADKAETPVLGSADSALSDWDLQEYAEGGGKVDIGF
ncbi:hypothetical protein HK104_005895 [Borealophlyctis nickersoniae]|nr:hypothetical protein HK104_005895 [Borealophlyctis nickersoniae]